MAEDRRLIEVAFPLKQASIDSVHEKNVRHAHISTLHIWPARRPLAACRAALVATLLPDPGDDAVRKRILERLGGKVVESVQRKRMPSGRVEDVRRYETVGGILHWGRETSPDLDWFREEIRKAYGGRAPRVLDPFAGGGAIPLEAMRLGCEVTAADINPVAWMILKCTLEYPQRLAGQKRQLPAFIRKDRAFLEAFLQAQGLKGAALRTQLERLGLGEHRERSFEALFPEQDLFDADLSWHVRAWGHWVLERGRADLERFYPTIDQKPAVAYLWARTVTCKGCRATVPLLKTRWLCKKAGKRVLLTMEPKADKSGVVLGTQLDVPVQGGNAAQRREHDKRVGAGTMTRSGATCPCCGTILSMEDIRLEGRAGRLGAVMTTVAVDGPKGKEYRLPTDDEIEAAVSAEHEVGRAFADLPFGAPNEPLPTKEALGFRVPLYGLDRWSKLFTPRQLVALGTLAAALRRANDQTSEEGYPAEWHEAIAGYLACAFDRMLDFNSVQVAWITSVEAVGHTFVRYALPMTWDYSEPAITNYVRGGWQMCLDGILKSLATISLAPNKLAPAPKPVCGSAIASDQIGQFDVVVTDPPYYDAIPYSDLMDFFYVWQRRIQAGLPLGCHFQNELGPKWDRERADGELIDDSSRFGGDAAASKAAYEDGMTRSFAACHRALTPEGRLVVVFANKKPAAWESLVAGMIRSGFVVDGSWPIQTEQAARMRAQGSAALSSSVWIVGKKRAETARPGWDNQVLDEMRDRIRVRLREFWDAGIHGPDFVWAATGPALEAYSRHPVVKKANEPGAVMSVSEFLRHVRRMVVDFVVGRVLTGDGAGDEMTGLDDVTTYYLLHRHDFGMGEAPIGPCILYAVSCGLSDADLSGPLEILVRKGGRGADEEDEQDQDDEGETEDEESEGGGNAVRLRPWSQRKRRSMGYEGQGGRPVPLIDQIHRLMHLWKTGDVVEVNRYLDERELRHNALFPYVLQALIELAEKEERTLLESLMNHVGKLGVRAPTTRDWIEG